LYFLCRFEHSYASDNIIASKKQFPLYPGVLINVLEEVTHEEKVDLTGKPRATSLRILTNFNVTFGHSLNSLYDCNAFAINWSRNSTVNAPARKKGSTTG
jgi:hypothetical protein